MSARILLVEDEKSLQKVLQINLEIEGYEVELIDDGEQGMQKLEEEHFDLLILDLMLPKRNGMEILNSLRLRDSEMPVIIISAKDTSSDRIKGLKSGADDYLIKPFDIEELLLRVQNLLKRNAREVQAPELDIFNFGNAQINFKTFTGQKQEVSFNLSEKEVLIMKLLIQNKNQVVSRKEILNKVWGYDVFPSTRTIDNFISGLRKHFEDDPRHPSFIKSVHGVGYKFEVEE